jgi:hypothetical protein
MLIKYRDRLSLVFLRQKLGYCCHAQNKPSDVRFTAKSGHKTVVRDVSNVMPGLVSKMSTIPPKADIRQRERHVRFGPKADIRRAGHPLRLRKFPLAVQDFLAWTVVSQFEILRRDVMQDQRGDNACANGKDASTQPVRKNAKANNRQSRP